MRVEEPGEIVEGARQMREQGDCESSRTGATERWAVRDVRRVRFAAADHVAKGG